MIEHLIYGGVGMLIGIFIGFMFAALLIGAKTYDDFEFEEDKKDDD